nr:uncharacterized protein CI109_007079 [Kwoniella shandongensis]KAA5524591.1 hypothetical protein CI109_007079 [Kwoniella shandongensis]
MQSLPSESSSSASSSRSFLLAPTPPIPGLTRSGSGTGSGSASGTASVGSGESQPGQYRDLIEEFKGYPFTLDQEFKAGLPAVVAQIRSMRLGPLGADEMVAKAQWFYFTRKKGVELPWSVYASYIRILEPRSSPSPRTTPKSSSRQLEPAELEGQRTMSASAVAEGDGGMSFDMLCRLVAEGKAGDLKGVTIPDELNPAAPTPSTLPQRPKPWEQRTATQTQLGPVHTIPFPPRLSYPPSVSQYTPPAGRKAPSPALNPLAATRTPPGGQLTLSPEIPLSPAYLASLEPPPSTMRNTSDTPYIPPNLNMEVETMEHLAQLLNGGSISSHPEEGAGEEGGEDEYDQWYGTIHGPSGSGGH